MNQTSNTARQHTHQFNINFSHGVSDVFIPSKTKAKDTRKASGSLAELIMTQSDSDTSNLLLPMIAHASQSADRWITLIGLADITKKQLQSYGVDTSKIRLINCDSNADNGWIIWEALNAGTSHTVVAMSNELDRDGLEKLREIALEKGCHGLLVRERH